MLGLPISRIGWQDFRGRPLPTRSYLYAFWHAIYLWIWRYLLKNALHFENAENTSEISGVNFGRFAFPTPGGCKSLHQRPRTNANYSRCQPYIRAISQSSLQETSMRSIRCGGYGWSTFGITLFEFLRSTNVTVHYQLDSTFYRSGFRHDLLDIALSK